MNTQNKKVYILQQPMPNIEIGCEFIYNESDGKYHLYGNVQEIGFHSNTVENNPTWFLTKEQVEKIELNYFRENGIGRHEYILEVSNTIQVSKINQVKKEIEYVLNGVEEKGDNFCKLEMEKCTNSQYYFFTKYWKVNGKDATTNMNDRQFNDVFSHLNDESKLLKEESNNTVIEDLRLYAIDRVNNGEQTFSYLFTTKDLIEDLELKVLNVAIKDLLTSTIKDTLPITQEQSNEDNFPMAMNAPQKEEKESETTNDVTLDSKPLMPVEELMKMGACSEIKLPKIANLQSSYYGTSTKCSFEIYNYHVLPDSKKEMIEEAINNILKH